MSFIKRIEEEKEQLSFKIKRLHEFFLTDKFEALDKFDQLLLSEQYIAMQKYESILEKRLIILTKQAV